MSDEHSSLRAVVHGRVQGVGFRFFVIEAAAGLGLTGYVRNLSNGSVEVVAEGRQPSLDALLAGLRRGPALARVDRVDVSWAAYTGEHETFRVR